VEGNGVAISRAVALVENYSTSARNPQLSTLVDVDRLMITPTA
jgi:hypothetical protein